MLDHPFDHQTDAEVGMHSDDMAVGMPASLARLLGSRMLSQAFNFIVCLRGFLLKVAVGLAHRMLLAPCMVL